MTDSETLIILSDLYASEINYRISTFWDEGYTALLGDALNGWKAENNGLRSWDEITSWLRAAACQHFPESEFARKHGSTMPDRWRLDPQGGGKQPR